MSNRPRTAELAELGADLSAPVRAFVTDLRTCFRQLNVSVRVYANRRHVAAATLSRYLNGSRPVPWKFVEELLDDVARECGADVTAEAVNGLRALYEADREARQPVPGLHRLEDRLREADHEVCRLRAEKRTLNEALQESEAAQARQAAHQQKAEAELHTLKDEHRVQSRELALWQGLSLGLAGAFLSLDQQAAWLRQALAETQAALKDAEARRDHLEQQLQAAEDLQKEGISGSSLMEVLEAADRTTSVPDLVQLVGGLATSPRQAFASELVASASRCRPVQEVTALLSALYAAGLHQHAEAALPALVAMRPVQDIADLVTALLESGLEEPVVALLQASVKLHTPNDLAALCGLLYQRSCREAVLVLLGATATCRAVEEIVAVYTLLDGPGLHDSLAQTITAPAANRPCAELAALVIQLHQAGFTALAETLQSTIAMERTATDVADLIGALHEADLPAAAAAVFWQTQQRTTGHLVALTSALHIANQYHSAAEVLTHALASRSSVENARLIIDLHVAGRHQEASHALATALRTFPAPQVRNLLDCLDQTHPTTDAHMLLTEAASRCSFSDAADMLVSLHDCGLHEHAYVVYTCTVQERPTGHAAAALAQLHRHHPDHLLAPHTLRTQAGTASASEVTNLSLALHAARLETRLQAVLSGGVLERSSTQAALVIKNLEGLHTLSKGQSTDVIYQLLKSFVRDQPVDVQLGWVKALEAAGATGSRKRLISLARAACPTQEFNVKLYALEVSGRLQERGPWTLLLWKLRFFVGMFD
ncbi:hypothetical protein [Streptomyces canus]|uniref:hypothetical protein n=1 Tax=Streptomyces canus TaxID=58343 RepID=UPI003711092F